MQLKNILQLLGLYCLPVVIIFGIWYIWFGPGNEPGPEFPKDQKGNLVQQVTVTIKEEKIFAEWIIPARCSINEIEFQELEYIHKRSDWFGGTADCTEQGTEQGKGFTCSVDLSNRNLPKGVTYILQAYGSQCAAGGGYYASVITSFSL